MKLPLPLQGAMVLTALFLLLHLLGGRQYVGVLSGTREGGSGSLVFGLAYALSWFCTVLLVPPLLLTGLARLTLLREPAAPRR